jgi:hypothetical protein
VIWKNNLQCQELIGDSGNTDLAEISLENQFSPLENLDSQFGTGIGKDGGENKKVCSNHNNNKVMMNTDGIEDDDSQKEKEHESEEETYENAEKFRKLQGTWPEWFISWEGHSRNEKDMLDLAKKNESNELCNQADY